MMHLAGHGSCTWTVATMASQERQHDSDPIRHIPQNMFFVCDVET